MPTPSKPRIAPHDIGALLRASRDEYAALAAQQGLFLKIDVPEAPLWGLTDADQLIRIVGNLVNNAIKFTTSGGVTLSARLAPDGRIVVRVSDTGPGIPAHERERVFEEFYQIGNPSRDRAQGLGLGLAIVRRTADLLKIELQAGERAGPRHPLRTPARSRRCRRTTSSPQPPNARRDPSTARAWPCCWSTTRPRCCRRCAPTCTSWAGR